MFLKTVKKTDIFIKIFLYATMLRKTNHEIIIDEKVLEELMIWEKLHSVEFLTEKEKRELKRVEKFVDKRRDKTLQHISKRKEERKSEEIVDSLNFRESKYRNPDMEKLVNNFSRNCKNQINWRDTNKIIKYLIYLTILGGVVIYMLGQLQLF